MHIGTYIRLPTAQAQVRGRSKQAVSHSSCPREVTATLADTRGAALRGLPAAQGCPAAGRWLDTAGSLDTAKYGCIRVQFGYGGYVSAM